MVFNSLFFIFLFLPVSLILYRLVPHTIIKNMVLLLLSLLFYAWNEPYYVLLLLLNICWNYFTGLELEQEEDQKKKRILFWVAVGVNLAILGAFKYTNFILGIFGVSGLELSLPVGLSFYTFSSISYIADVYRQTSPASKNPLHLALYIAFFGKITSGPIVFYHDMEHQLEYHPLKKQLFLDGLTLFTKGLIKKVLFADQLSIVFSSLAGNTSMLGAWLYAISYMLEIYFDFSGYSDMAIGIGNMFGFTMKPNFNHPYAAVSVQDFWRRWHISLSTWFRDYVYIPLGGNRHDYIRNIIIVWFLTGLWHGANWTFIVWGLYYGAFVLLEKFLLSKYLSKIPRILSRIYTLFVVLIGWVFFCSDSVGSALSVIGRMFHLTELVNTDALFALTGHIPLLVVGCILCSTVYDRLENFFLRRGGSRAVVGYTVVYLIFFVISIAFLVGSTYQSFLYFAF